MSKHTTSVLGRRLVAGAAALVLVLAACGGDDDEGGADTAEDTAEPAATEPAATEPAATEAPSTEPPATEPAATEAPSTEPPATVPTSALDSNGDGTVILGIAAAGPADDGAYYQAVVDAASEISEENGFGEPVVVGSPGTELEFAL